MFAHELKRYFNDTYGLDNPWPSTFGVDAETYGHCCQEVFNYLREYDNVGILSNGVKVVRISLGPNKGLMFKNVELILEKE